MKTLWESHFSQPVKKVLFLLMSKAADVSCPFWGQPSFANPLVVRWLSSGVESLASDLNSRLILWRNGALYQKSLGSCLAVNVKTVGAVSQLLCGILWRNDTFYQRIIVIFISVYVKAVDVICLLLCGISAILLFFAHLPLQNFSLFSFKLQLD